MKSKILTLIGFAQKSGKAVSGNEMVQAELKKDKVALVFIGSDISLKSSKKVLSLCEAHHVKYYTFFSVGELSQAIGKSDRTVVGIKRSELSHSIEKLLTEDNLAECT